jgi:predicted nicotinamide N-methyase
MTSSRAATRLPGPASSTGTIPQADESISHGDAARGDRVADGRRPRTVDGVTAPPRPEPDLVPRRFAFGGEELDVLVPRDMEALLSEEAFEHEEFLPYWAQSWPSGPALADRLTERDLTGLPVLELGCGLGLPSLLAARLGARITASDWAPDALALLADNAGRNDVALELLRLDWFAPEPSPTTWPLVIAADVLYEGRHVAPLLATLALVVAPGGEAWIADPGRPPARRFWPAAVNAGWSVDVLGDEVAAAPVVRRLRRASR